MHKILTLSALITALIFPFSNAADATFNADEVATTLQTILQDINTNFPNSGLKEIPAGLQDLREEEILKIAHNAIKGVSQLPNKDLLQSASYATLNNLHKSLKKRLSAYSPSLQNFASHVSTSFFKGGEKFKLDIKFTNDTGDEVVRPYELSYSSFGWQTELVYRVDSLFFVGNKTSLCQADETISFYPGFTCSYRIPFSFLSQTISPRAEFLKSRKFGFDLSKHIFNSIHHHDEYSEPVIRDVGYQYDFETARQAALISDESFTRDYPLIEVGITILPSKGNQGTLVI